MFEAIKYVTGGLTLAAFVVAAIAVVVRAALRRKQQLILAAPENERARLVELAFESFHIDTTPLTKTDKYNLLLSQMAYRQKRLNNWLRFWIGITVVAGITAIALSIPFASQLFAHFEGIQPHLLKPYDGTLFDDYPRHVTLEWEAVPKATGYEVEVQWQLPDDKSWHTVRDYPKTVDVPTYSFDFVGAQPGRWRAIATTKGGKRSSWSDWRSFSFTR